MMPTDIIWIGIYIVCGRGEGRRRGRGEGEGRREKGEGRGEREATRVKRVDKILDIVEK
jgi:hypothetical protein